MRCYAIPLLTTLAAAALASAAEAHARGAGEAAGDLRQPLMHRAETTLRAPAHGASRSLALSASALSAAPAAPVTRLSLFGSDDDKKEEKKEQLFKAGMRPFITTRPEPPKPKPVFVNPDAVPLPLPQEENMGRKPGPAFIPLN